MPERRKDSGFWTHPWVQKLPPLGKLLYDYFFSNDHCNAAGLYSITLRTVAFETGIKEDEISALLALLKKNIAWYPEKEIIWVKEFLNRQTKSPQFLKASAKALSDIPHKEIVEEVISFNLKQYNLAIPYEVGFPNSVPLNKDGLDENVASMIELYERKAGRVPTPGDLERIKDFSQTYPDGWFDKALDEYPTKPLSYIAKVMEGWKLEGVNPLDKSSARTHKGTARGIKDRKDYKTPEQHRRRA